MKISNNPSELAIFFVVIFIAAITWIGLKPLLVPVELHSQYEADQFSAARAKMHVFHLAVSPHPIGSPEHARVQQYILNELAGMGLQPELQSGFAVHTQKRGHSVGDVQNIVVRIPGREHGKALLLSAHYDSTPGGAGAGDDAASVAAILETLRALQHRPTLKNDVICIFSDGEEADLLGAELFAREHPLISNVALVLNFDFRGNGGPVLMFETGHNNSYLVESFARNVPNPIGSSLMYEVYRNLPHDTDFSVYKRVGLTGMNFAAIDGFNSYHSELDRADLLSDVTLQHLGETMLSLADYFGNHGVDVASKGDAVYFNFPGLGLISYSVDWVFPLSVLATFLFAAMCFQSVKLKIATPKTIVIATFCFLGAILLASGVTQVVWLGIKWLQADYYQFIYAEAYNSQWNNIAFFSASAAFFIWFSSKCKNVISLGEFHHGVLAVCLGALWFTSINYPGATYLFTWPLIAIQAGILSSRLLRKSSIYRIGMPFIELASLVIPVLILLPLIYLVNVALTSNMVWVPIGLFVILLGLALPVIEGLLTFRFSIIKILMAISLGCLLIGSINTNFDKLHPKFNNLNYGFDVNSGKAIWFTFDEFPDEWTSRYISPPIARETMLENYFGAKSFPLWNAEAPVMPVSIPQMQLISDTFLGEEGRRIVFRVVPSKAGEILRISVDANELVSGKIQGHIVELVDNKQWQITSRGMQDKPLEVELLVKPSQPLTVRITEQTNALPQVGMVSRNNIMLQLPGLGDQTWVVQSFTLR